LQLHCGDYPTPGNCKIRLLQLRRKRESALNALTLTLAGELRDAGILVNSVCPGWVATEMGGAGGRPIPEGAASVVWAATLLDDGPTGGFYRDGKPLDW
jgi:NAD(P)-dependent dehydrogenase (short-subunit alcohol dehydrogenase family)